MKSASTEPTEDPAPDAEALEESDEPIGGELVPAEVPSKRVVRPHA